MKQSHLSRILSLIILSSMMSLISTYPSLAYTIEVLNAVYPSASEEQKCLFIDQDGLVWIGSDNGIKSYDGYRFNIHRSSAKSPYILPSNNIQAITGTKVNSLWIGTKNGLVKMNKQTGKFTTHRLSQSKPSKGVFPLFTARNGDVWLGYGGASLFRYSCREQKFHTYDNHNTIVVEPNGKSYPMPRMDIQSFTENKKGEIYLGTWGNGIYRVDTKRNRMYKLDVWKGEEQAAHAMKFDRKGRLWVGTWGHGVCCLTSPWNPKSPGYISLYKGGNEFSINYRLIEDPISNTIWTCSRDGIGIIDEDNIGAGVTYLKEIGQYKKYNVQSTMDLATDGKGNIWALTLNKGLLHLNTNPSKFMLTTLPTSNLTINSINSISSRDGRYFWMAMAPAGIAFYDLTTQQIKYNYEIHCLRDIAQGPINTHINCIMQRRNQETWLASDGFGIIIIKDGKAKLWNQNNCKFVRNGLVRVLLESKKEVVFIGENGFFNYILPSGKIVSKKIDGNVTAIVEDRHGNIWLSTEDRGCIHMTGDISKPSSLSLRYYNLYNKKLGVNDITNCIEDSHHRVWAISKSGGLFKYDTTQDVFTSMSDAFYGDLDRILSIIEDEQGNLWLTTDNTLVCLSIDEAGNIQRTTYTHEDGLGSILFQPNSCLRMDNMLYFGSGKDLIRLNVSRNKPHLGNKAPYNIIITDLIINDKSYTDLDSALQVKISSVRPSHMRSISIPASISKFSVEFALLSYRNTDQCKYAYFLEGYDNTWHYVDASIRQATFENLSAGRYKLHIKAADSYGRWNELPYTIHIKVLPPWYASWWAYLIYIVLLFIGIRFTVVWYRERLRTKNRLQMAVIFTNITHELLTPLTVISAAADSIKRLAPSAESQAAIIHDNINRLTRMLRQILEVRKAQAGKLQLKVSEGKLGDFCAETIHSLTPMFMPKQLTFEQHITCMGETAWFDTDKVENIIYNLLSNATKYTEPGGKVSFSMSMAEKQAILVVSDTGIGISKDKMKHLYNRFLDGDYRQMKTFGTGIGLSLVNDLVKLHHGKISCESEEGKGTTFTIILPINKESYAETEILKQERSISATSSIILPNSSKSEEAIAATQNNTSMVNKAPQENNKEYTILLVEDNQELLSLMSSLLSDKYKVLTATNGEKAQRLIKKASLDVVVTDVMMPVIDGIELTKWIKTSEDYAQLPVVMLTAKTQIEDRNEAYRVGADAYITKPFKLEDLQLRIDNIIANRQRIRQKFQTQTDFKVEDQHYSNPDELFIKSVIEKVNENMMNSEYGREQLAADLCISSSTLYNKLRAITGQNISSFITSIRMKEACRILRCNPNIRINELCYQVGFSTPRYFSQCFKKEFGMGAKEYAESILAE